MCGGNQDTVITFGLLQCNDGAYISSPEATPSTGLGLSICANILLIVLDQYLVDLLVLVRLESNQTAMFLPWTGGIIMGVSCFFEDR